MNEWDRRRCRVSGLTKSSFTVNHVIASCLCLAGSPQVKNKSEWEGGRLINAMPSSTSRRAVLNTYTARSRFLYSRGDIV